MIASRDELIAALNEASELEHGLLAQYLFAALSLRRDVDAGTSARHAELARGWAGSILKVARDEMAHLGNVCNMLNAIGGAPRFERPNFPQAATRYYPFEFSLERFSAATLQRFLRFEQPKGEPLPGIKALKVGAEPPAYDYVGELYRAIGEAFRTLDEKDLFIGPQFAQDIDDWSNPGRFRLYRVKDRATALAAIDAIVAEGEGAPGHREGSHFATFTRVWDEYTAAGMAEEVSYPVAANPRTRRAEDAPDGGTMITDERTLRVAKLFNHVYDISLTLLLQYYSFAGESAAQRAAIQLVARSAMGCGVRPLAEILTTMPVGKDAPGLTAGPPFELVTRASIPTYVPSRWVVIEERLVAASHEAKDLAAGEPRFAFLAENLEIMAMRIARVAREGAA